MWTGEWAGESTRERSALKVRSIYLVAFTIAMNRVYKLQTGEKKEEVSFVRVVVWGRLAEVCNDYLKKGRPVFVEGRLERGGIDT